MWEREEAKSCPELLLGCLVCLSTILFNTVRICSCLEAIDKYVPLFSKFGILSTHGRLKICFEAGYCQCSLSQRLGAGLRVAQPSLPAFKGSGINSGLCLVRPKVRNLILTFMLMAILWESWEWLMSAEILLIINNDDNILSFLF